MKPINQTINELISPDANLTFLAGAGCSIDPPSCLVAGKPMMEAIIDYTCVASDIKLIKSLKELRFEMLIEIIEYTINEGINIIEYYGECDKPNQLHFFLAEMIKKGNFVITTNFDFLIEYALQKSEVPNNEIIPVITREDYNKFSDPLKLFNDNKKPVYKVHRSTKNIITGEDTKEYLIVTLSDLGSNKQGLSVFQVEPFKKPLFDNISKDRTLVVLGYSGSDDFDIIPTIKALKDLKNIFWINHVAEMKNESKIYYIDENTKEMGKINQILKEIKKNNDRIKIYRIDTNTSNIINELLSSKPTVDQDNYAIKVEDWLRNNIEQPNELNKYLVTTHIYSSLDIFDKALACLYKLLKIAENSHDEKWQLTAHKEIGNIFSIQGKIKKAFNELKKARKIAQNSGDLYEITVNSVSIAEIYRYKGDYTAAMKEYDIILPFIDQMEASYFKAVVLHNIGLIYSAQGNFDSALKNYEEALQINEEIGDIEGKSRILNTIGSFYRNNRKYDKAIECFREALLISNKIGDLDGKAEILKTLGFLEAYGKGNHKKALENYEEALQIRKDLGFSRKLIEELEEKVSIMKKWLELPEDLRLRDINYSE